MTPTIWILQGGRAGDDAQASELAARLAGNVRGIRLQYNWLHHFPNFLLGASTASVVAKTSALLVPPWPQLVIGAGKRSAPIARWIKAKSGGRTRIVQLGRPRARLDAFDLIVTTPQYGLPPAPNAIEIGLPFAVMKSVPQAQSAALKNSWRLLPKPWIVLTIGAGRFPLSLAETELRRLGKQANELAAGLGGSLLVFASPRSAPEAMGLAAAEISAPHICYPWLRNEPNPYQAALALADRFIVTSDSISMISEALSTGRPVSLFPLPVSSLHFTWNARRGFAAWLARTGLLHPPRDITRISHALVEGGYASELGAASGVTRPFQRNDEAAIGRIKALLAESAGQNSLASRKAS